MWDMATKTVKDFGLQVSMSSYELRSGAKTNWKNTVAGPPFKRSGEWMSFFTLRLLLKKWLVGRYLNYRSIVGRLSSSRELMYEQNSKPWEQPLFFAGKVVYFTLLCFIIPRFFISSSSDNVLNVKIMAEYLNRKINIYTYYLGLHSRTILFGSMEDANEALCR